MMKSKKILALVCAAAMTIGLMACGSSGAAESSAANTPDAAAESFMAKYPDVTVTAEFTGSSAGVEATAENIKSGDYFLCRPFVMATKGEIAEQSDAVKALFDYLASEEGKEVIKGVGLITVD